MRQRTIRVIAPLATLVAVLSCGGADGLAPTTSSAIDPTLLAGLYASAPMASGYISSDRIGASGSAASRNPAGSTEVSWVSLVPGTVPDGTIATIVNGRTAQRDTVPIVEGGFDPSPIPASVGDTLQVTVSRPGKPETAAVMSLAARPGPRIVRARPPRGQTDAPLNTIITLVFSEPLDPASVNSTSVTLTTAGAPVAGAIRVAPGPGYTVELTPTALLTPGTAYSVTVNGIVDLSGTPLAEPVSIPFTTSATSGLTLLPPNVGVIVGDTIRLQGWVYRRPYTHSTEALEWTISDSSVASIRLLSDYSIEVQALRSGVVTVSARTLGSQQQLSARASLKVYGRSSQPSPIVVQDWFSIVEQERAGSSGDVFEYVASLRLRDTSASQSTRVVGITIDLPGSGHPPIYCAPNHVLGAGIWTPFAPPRDENDTMLGRQGDQRLPDLTVIAVAHVSAVLSDSLGVSFAVRGDIWPERAFEFADPASGINDPPCTQW